MDFDTVPSILREPLARWWERAGAEGAGGTFARAYAGLPARLRSELPRAAAGSEFIAAALIQDPAALEWFASNEN